LFGFESKLADGKAGEIEKKVLEEEGIALKDFQIKSFAELSSKGSRKKIVLVVHEPELLEIAADELNEGRLKARIRFWLDKGNYATTVLAELMKNSSG
jgi:tRNA pseudouridine13 synthase